MLWKYSIVSNSQCKVNNNLLPLYSLASWMDFREATRRSLDSVVAKQQVFNGD
jgi:hypothetical protein